MSGARRVLTGIAASRGSVVGTPVVLDAPGGGSGPAVVDLETAVATVQEHYARLEAGAEAAGRDEEAEVLGAYQLLAGDPELLEPIRAVEGMPLDEAVAKAGGEQVTLLASLGDEYLAQRAEDLASVVTDLVSAVRGQDLAVDVELPADAVVVAEDLTPAQTSQLDLDRIVAFVVARGGRTSHTAIVARSLGLPAVVGAAGVVEALHGISRVLVDGDEGTVTAEPDDDDVAAAEARASVRAQRRAAAARMTGIAVHLGGHRVLVAANVGDERQLAAAVDAQADGIGLYRSEFLFLGDAEPPTREEQAAAYREAVAAFEDPVIIRTLDIGGDKDADWLELRPEDNPFLGVRGLRLCLAMPDLFATQLDALLEVPGDNLRIMLPMVTSLSDVRRARALLEERAAAAGRDTPQLGAMVETPAAALLAEHLVREVDFLSIGTNDLTQYTCAADRGIGGLAEYHDPLQPPVLALAAHTARTARAAGVPVGVCGAAAADPAAAILLLGSGVDELSVPAREVDAVRALVDELDPAVATELAEAALRLPDADAVRQLVAERLPRTVA